MTYFGTRLSENISRREPEGYLICLNVPVARTGVQEYLPSELGLPEPDDRLIPVCRPEEEVFSPACVASFEGMPVTDDHPSAPDGVTAENSRYLIRGHAQHVRRGSGAESDLLLADLMITDPVLVEEILTGKREISCGYTYTLCEEDGKLIQREIRGNHVAVVDTGRAGPRVSIRDQEPKGAAAKLQCTSAPASPDSGPGRSARGLPDHSAGRPARAITPGADGRSGSKVYPGSTSDHFERSSMMKKKSLWRAKLMARMAKDGDVDGLAELITETMEEPAAVLAAVPAEAALPAGDPLVNAVASAVAENLEPAADEEVTAVPAAVPAAAAPASAPAAPAVVLPVNAAAPAAVPESPVVVETPGDQPVNAESRAHRGDCSLSRTAHEIDCSSEILEALRQIISLLSGPAADCNTEVPTGDEDPSATVEAVAETAVEQMAQNVAAAAVEAMAETVDPALASGNDLEGAAPADPVEELVAEILDSEDPAQTDPDAPVTDEEEILSSILEPVEGEDEDGEDPEAAAKAADALRTALASFRPQLKRMTPKQRQRFNADVAARMKRLTRRQQARNGRPNAYAALRKAAVHDSSARSLGQKIMASRNANLRKK